MSRLLHFQNSTEPSMLKVDPKSQAPILMAYDEAVTPTKRQSGRRRGRPRKNMLSLPGIEEPWQVDSSPVKSGTNAATSELGNVPPSLGMFTSSPVAESPQTVSRTNKWRLPKALSPRKDSSRPDIDDSTESRPASPLADRSTLRGLSIKDIPSSPVQGYHVSFMKGFGEDDDDEALSSHSSASNTPTLKRKSSTYSSCIDLVDRVARPALKRTFSEQYAAELYSASSTASFPASFCPSVSGARRISFVIANGRAAVAHTDNDDDTGDDDTASSLSAYSIPPAQLEVARSRNVPSQMEISQPETNQLECSENLHSQLESAPMQHSTTIQMEDEIPSAFLLQESHTSSSLSSYSSYSYFMSRPSHAADNPLHIWDMSDSEADSDIQDPSNSMYSIYDDHKPAGDAMTAFAQTVARSRAKEKSRIATPPLRNGHRARLAGTPNAGRTTTINHNLLHTPVTHHSSNYPQGYSPFLKEVAATNKGVIVASPYPTVGFSLNPASIQTSDPGATTPPGSMLLIDDAFGSGFGSTGMTPYLPGRG